MFKSWSIALCADRDPACALVVPRAEKKTLGGGLMVVKYEDQLLVSVLMWGLRASEVVGRARLAMAWMLAGATEGFATSPERM